STDVSLVDGPLAYRTEATIDGLPVRVPALDIHTVGAGGGSLARLDAGGALRVGPESAGAVPGPACYGRGTEPTVTDAHVVLGRPRVYVPRHPGLLSAFGALTAETIRDFASTLRAVDPSVPVLAGGFRRLERMALATFRKEGLARPRLERGLDVRYAGQGYEVQVGYGTSWRAAFHARHAALFAHADPRRPVEVVALRVRARSGG